MAFKDNIRLEQIYFANLKTLIVELKKWKDGETSGTQAYCLLESCIQANSAIILLYKNLGEEWNELTAFLQKNQKDLVDLKDVVEQYKEEINEKIDEVNNYLLSLIRSLEDRVTSLELRMDAVESDLLQMGRIITYDIERENDEYNLYEGDKNVTFNNTASYFNHNKPHLVIVRGVLDSETTYLFPREYDTNNSGLFEWYAVGFVGNEIHEITVTLLPDNTVNVAIEKTNFADIRSKLGSLIITVNDLIERVTRNETDIDTLETTAENLEANKQDKLVAGSGISIDPETNEITNTAQGATYTGSDYILVNETSHVISFKKPHLGLWNDGTGLSTIHDARLSKKSLSNKKPLTLNEIRHLGKEAIISLSKSGETFNVSPSTNGYLYSFDISDATTERPTALASLPNKVFITGEFYCHIDINAGLHYRNIRGGFYFIFDEEATSVVRIKLFNTYDQEKQPIYASTTIDFQFKDIYLILHSNVDLTAEQWNEIYAFLNGKFTFDYRGTNFG